MCGRTVVAGLTALLIVAPAAATEFTFSVDVPTRLGTIDFLPRQTIHYLSTGSPSYTLQFAGSGLGDDVNLDALALLPGGSFLFSTDAPLTVGTITFQPADVVRYDAGTSSYSLFQSGTALGLPASANVDAIAFDAAGRLVLSFDAPETVGSVTYQPSDLVLVSGTTLSLLLSGASLGLTADANVTGIELANVGDRYLMFDAPLTVGSLTIQPGSIARHDGSAWSLWFTDPAFPMESAGTDFSFPCVGISYSGTIDVSHTGATTQVSWTAGGAGLFDMVRGDLVSLRASAGNFTSALNAIAPGTDVCMADNTQAAAATDLRADPPSGGGYFYLVRGVAGCGQGGSYDDGTQVAGRDAGINAASAACP